ncbi:MAG: glucose-6-phosphate dehydrogenase [Pseudomonadota bacterium]
MVSRIIAVDPFDLVVFGGTGDLALRKLYPGLFHRDQDGQMPASSRIIAVSRQDLGRETFRQQVADALIRHVDESERETACVDRFLSRLHFVRADALSESGWSDLKKLIKTGRNGIVAYYLAVAPALFGPICERLKASGLAGGDARVVIEKPIGRDSRSARQINTAVGSAFSEHRIFRIDHYLGKETVQNLMALRFANALFEPLWNSAHIDHVQITVAESIGVEGRGAYYDEAGALRDMVQNHILQLLCLVAMEPPAAFTADSVRDEKLKVLRALKPIDETNASQVTVRGQYTAGAAADGAVPAYADEVGGRKSTTETFVAVKAAVENWRWSGVPFYLRTGKRMVSRVSDVVIHFKAIPHSIFDDSAGEICGNKLVVRLQPDEKVELSIMIKDPGPGGMRLRKVPLDMSFQEAFDVRSPDAYERLLMDVIRGNPTLFMRRDEVDAAWDWIDPILSAWERTAQTVSAYRSGTWGPTAAIALIERDGRTWHEDGL